MNCAPDPRKSIPVVQSVRSWLAQTENWIYHQIRALPEAIECHVVCERTANLEQYPVPRLYSLNQASWWRSYWDRGLRKLGLRRHLGFLVYQMKRHRARVLHSHFGDLGWLNLGAVKSTQAKHVVTFYGYDVNHLPNMDLRWRKRYAELFLEADCILCEGPHMAKCLIAQGCLPEKIKAHHLGVPVERVPFKPRRWDGRTPLRVLIAGSFVEKKGIPDALSALAKVSRDIPLAITLIGDSRLEDKPQLEKQRIVETIERFHIGPIVHRLGYVSQQRWFEEAYRHHLFMAPSLTASDGDTEGGLPVSLIEAAATGMLVLSTAHCDIPQMIQHQVTGLLAPEQDVAGLAEQLVWLADQRDNWLPILEAARARVEAQYNTVQQGLRLAGIYAELCGQSG